MEVQNFRDEYMADAAARLRLERSGAGRGRGARAAGSQRHVANRDEMEKPRRAHRRARRVAPAHGDAVFRGVHASGRGGDGVPAKLACLRVVDLRGFVWLQPKSADFDLKVNRARRQEQPS